MRKLTVVGAVLMIAIVVAIAGFAGAGRVPEAFPAPNAGPYSISSDGYSNGIRIWWDSAYVIHGDRMCSCCSSQASYQLGGKLSYMVDSPAGVGWTIGYETNSGGGAITYFGVYRLQPSRTWTFYYFDGSVLNSGTWSWCPPKGNATSTGTLPDDFAAR